MRFSTHLRWFLVLVVALALLSSCSKSVEEKFYDKNRDNPDLMMFDGISIIPQRSSYVIRLWKYGGIQVSVFSYDESRDPRLVLHHGEKSLQRLMEEYNLDHDSAMQYLTKLFSIFNELDVLAVYGRRDHDYIKFVIDPSHVVVYVPDWSKLTKISLEDVTRLEKKATRKFDDHWFVYEPDKPYDFGG